MHIQLLLHFPDTALDLEREKAASQAAAVAENANAFPLQRIAVDVRQQRNERRVDAGAVHVAAHGRHGDGGLDASGKLLLRQGDEGLFDVLVGQRRGVVEVSQLGGDVGEERVGRVGEEVVVEQARIRLGDELAGRSVEANMVEAIEGRVDGLVLAYTVQGCAVDVSAVELGFALVVATIAVVDGFGVAFDGEVAVHDRVLGGEVGLVEVVGVRDVGAAETRFKGQRCVGTDEHGNAASTTRRAGVAFLVQGNVARHDDCVAAIPGGGLDPVDRVEECIGTAVAGVHRVHTLDVCVARLFEELHEDGLDGF